MEHLRETDPELARVIADEARRQAGQLEMIASENFVSRAVLEAMGTVLTNKYAEGLPGRRYYGGCEVVDVAENLARERAKQLFGAEHANVQPHSGTQANMAVYLAVLEPGDTFMGMNLAHGGHLSHGHPLNFSGRFYQVVPYGVREDDERIDYDEMARLAKEKRPKMIMVGASAYPRFIDFARFRAVADEVGAVLVVDMAHIAGLVAGGVHPSPVPHADVVTSTTHKTLRGPRGGLILELQSVAAFGRSFLQDRLVFKAPGPLESLPSFRVERARHGLPRTRRPPHGPGPQPWWPPEPRSSTQLLG